MKTGKIVKEAAITLGLTWAMATNGISFVQSMITAGDNVPAEGVVKAGTINSIGAKLSVAASAIPYELINGSNAYAKVLFRAPDACTTMPLTSDLENVIEQTAGGTAEKIFAANQAIIGSPGVAVGLVLEGIALGGGEILTNGKMTNPDPCAPKI